MFTKNNIYVCDHRYYKKIKPMTGRYDGMFLWRPMKKVFFFFIPDSKRADFILDSSGFFPYKKDMNSKGEKTYEKQSKDYNQ